MLIKKRVGQVDSYIINSLFDKFVEFIVGNGYARAVVTDDTSKICSIEKSLCNFLLGLGIRKASIIKFLLIYFVIKRLKISKIILYSGFQISLRDARRILRVLGWKIDIAYSSSTGTPGLEIANFVAGIAPYVERRNAVAYIVSNVSAIRLL